MATIDTWSGTEVTTATVYYEISYDDSISNVRPWGNYDLDYGDQTYRGLGVPDGCIKVDRGSPAKARYAVFYAVEKDPVIFCKRRRDMIREVKKLLKRKDVDVRSIRIFRLVGGAKKVVKK